MLRFNRLAIGVFIFLCFGRLAIAEPTRSVSTTALWATRTWYVHPTDFCRYGDSNICAIPLADDKSEPTVRATFEPVRIDPKPKSTPPYAGHYPNKTIFMAMAASVYVAAWIDMRGTYPRSKQKGFQEVDPLARPFLKLPAPAYYATGFALATGINYLGWRMSRSRKFRRIWFIPQALTIAGNVYGRASSSDVGTVRP
jgi:hypothetical protein